MLKPYISILLLLCAICMVFTENNHDRNFNLRKILNNQTLNRETDLKHFMSPEVKEALNNVDMSKMIRQFKDVSLNSLPISPECTNSFFKVFGILLTIKTLNVTIIKYILSQPVGKALDSFGKPPERILIGDLNWLGAYDECSNIEGMKYCTNSMEFIGYPGGRYGTCFPKECSAKELQQIAIPWLNSVFSGLVTLNNDMLCDDPLVISHVSKAAIGGCIFLLILCFVSTFFDIVFQLRTFCTERIRHQRLSEDSNVAITTFEKEVEPLDNNRENVSMRTDLTATKSLIHDLLTSFSVIRNIRAILSTKSPKGAIGSINGIRTISMFWVILGHVYFFGITLNVFDNTLEAVQVLHRFSFMAVGNAFFSVDSFFVLSGLLVAYLMFRRFDANKESLVRLILKIVFSNIHRFIRLTPSLLFLMSFYTNIFPLLLTGPNALSMQQTSALTEGCNKYWWTNLLYINNFYPDSMGAECVGWVWYLANDMQFYLFSPILLVPMFLLDQKFSNSPLRYIFPLVYLSSWILLFSIITAIIISYWDLPVVQMASSFPGNPRAANAAKFGDYVYEKPYTRISAYLVGIGLGYLLSRKVRMPSYLKPIITTIGWLFAIVIGLSVVYGPWKVFAKTPTFLNDAENVSYGTLSRLSWGLALSWVIYACHNNVGWLVDSFLSWKFWIPLSRLTYGAYLLHPLVLIYFYVVGETRNHYEDNLYVFNIISIVVMSYASSFVLAVGLEFPVLNLEKRLLKPCS